MMRRWVAVLVVMVGMSAAARAEERPFDPARDPAKDLRVAMQRAQAEHKNILMDVGGNWCEWCIVLEETLHGDAELNALLAKNYVVMHVNWSKENENKAFLKRYPAPVGFPTWYVLSAQGRLLKAETNTSELEANHDIDGGYNKAALKRFLVRYAPMPVSQPVA
jgi:thiol:disulfide interchange protein